MYTGFPNLAHPTSEIKIPHDGSRPGIAWAKIDELGEATARLIKIYVDAPTTFEYANRVMLLSGPREWSIADTVRVVGQVVEKDIKIIRVGVEEYANEPVVIENLGAHGPGEVPRQWASSFEAVRKGETAVTSVDLGRLLGREPEGFEKTVRAMVKG